MSRALITAVAPRWESQVATVLGGSTRVHLVRRCADVPELIGVARAGLAQVALVSTDLRGLDREVVEALRTAGLDVVAVHPPGEQDPGRALRRWGVTSLIAADAAPGELDAVLAGLEEPDGDHEDPDGDDGSDGTGPDPWPRAGAEEDDGREPEGPAARAGGSEGRGGDGHPSVGLRRRTLTRGGRRGSTTPEAVPSPEGAEGPALDVDSYDPAFAEPAPPPPEPAKPGQILVVWGPYGSVGRTTVAVNLAAELATPLEPVLLIDADTYGASVAQSLAVLDEAPGIAAAARAADQGVLDQETLQRLAPAVRPGLHVLTGLPRADRWTELREASLADVLEECRQVARWVVVDVAPLVEQDEELSFDTGAPRRNGATLTALSAADRVLVVGSGDPVGLQRLVRALDQLPQLSAGAREVVVTRVRPGPVGPEPGRRIRETLSRFAGTDRVHLVPEDRESLDAALLHGRLLAEVRPGSPVRIAVQALADLCAGRESAPRAGRSRSLPLWSRVSGLRRG